MTAELAESSRTGGDRIIGFLRRGAAGARRFPLTVVVCVVLIVTGLVSQGFWRAVSEAGWFDSVAYGVPALRDGRWLTLLLGPWFGPTPGQYVSMVLLVASAFGIGEWRLGTRATLVVAVSGQLIGVLGACGLIVAAEATNWPWAVELAGVRDVGCTTAVIAVLAVATATVPSPWRLRGRAVLYGYVIVSFLFLGRFADVAHLIAFVVFVFAGERWYARQERGIRPRTNREARLVASIGLWLIALVHVTVYLVPGDGPFGPTSASDDAWWSPVLTVVVAGLLADQLRRGRRWAWWVTLLYALFAVIATMLVVVLVVTTDYESLGAVTAGTGLLWAGEAVLLIAGRSAFTVPRRRTVVGGGEPTDDPAGHARSLIRRLGGSTMSWMITWDGIDYFFPRGREAVIGFRRHAGVVIALADPVCEPAQSAAVIDDFRAFSESQAMIPCLFSVSEDTATVARQLGWRALQIAEDTLIDLPELQLAGKKWQKIRSAMNKADKAGTTFVLGRLAEQPGGVLTQVREISEQWVGEKGLPEMGFTLGTVEEALDDEVRVALAVGVGDNVQAVLSWLPVYGAGERIRGWTLDVMRKRTTPDANNTIEFLIARSALAFKEEGAEFVSLSGAPLARAEDSGDIRGIDKGLDLIGAALEPFYGFRSLHHFKTKFNPRYVGIYLCFRDEADLPRIGVAISRAYLPTATPRQLAAMLREPRG
ncbi:DUF2156 domain-containing protein [Nocardia cyriacigeorgica]|uniref:bifunctional lysylphosphatidylglycerol flippase/synthetase MprF n=1 Tax=Nocardia cyriacigeorgica TaxID=135487 RepID=UPI0013B6695A|nr:DUF2156 domain-containing protein [Nocardia cyriacigeorgica]NEW37541.1 DUF2156 domain-containing protein [Nocardia cyriacigeorgica]NEW49071.1 DUF2156 domain-containing protein [Nocardia cyriacigeorgica]